MFILALSVLFWSPSFVAHSSSCEPYLISNAKLTDILKINIGNAPLKNAQAIARKDNNCNIKLSADLSIDFFKSPISGCATPIHSDFEIGLSNIILEGLGKKIQLNDSVTNIKADIIKHCGTTLPIRELHTDDSGVFVIF
jgi:hypothetical protein